MLKERDKKGFLTVKQSRRVQRLSNCLAILIATNKSTSNLKTNKFFSEFSQDFVLHSKEIIP